MITLLRSITMTTIMFALATTASAEQTVVTDISGRDKVLKMVKTDTPPIMDGDMDEIWKIAPVIDDLHQSSPIEYAEPTQKTEVRVLYDEDFLYVSGKMYVDEPQTIVAKELVQRSNLRSEDKLRVYINPFNDGRNGYLFQLNPNNVRMEAIFENVRSLNFAWTAIYYSGAKVTDYGWFGEIAIPFKSISFDPNADTWGISFLRSVAAKNENAAWTSHNGNINPSNFGTAVGFEGLVQGIGLDVIPGLSLNANQSYNPDSSDTNIEPTLDIFYKFTPNLTGALTFNSDFSATNVDNRQVQLTRFSLFFPEQRKFFLQEADIFEFGGLEDNGKPFFSRRIGIADTGETLDLEAGGKLTGRIGKWNVGALAVQQGGNGIVDDSELFVARASLNVLDQSSIGAIVTHGNPNEDLDNSVVGVDFNYLNTRSFDNITITGELWYQQSDTEGVSGEDDAWGINIASPNREGFKGRFRYTSIGENYFPALGFANRVGIEERTGIIGHTTRFSADSRIQLIDKIFRNTRITDRDGNLETEEFRLVGQVESQVGDIGEVNFTAITEVLTEPFEIADNVTIPVDRYEFDRYGVEFETAGQRALSFEIELETGGFFGGDRDTFGTTINWRPSKHFSGALEYEYNDIDLPQGRFNTRLVRLETNYAFNSQWAWLTTTQYDNQSDSIGINSRLQWLPKDGQEIFLIYNGGWIDRTDRGGFEQVGQSATAKISYTFRY